MRLRMKHKVGTDLDTPLDDPAAPQFEQSGDENDKDEPAAADSDSDSDDEPVNDAEVERKQAAQRKKAQEAAEKDLKIVDQIMESGRLFIRNLPFSATDDEIQSFFESFGTVKQVSPYFTSIQTALKKNSDNDRCTTTTRRRRRFCMMSFKYRDS